MESNDFATFIFEIEASDACDFIPTGAEVGLLDLV